jgi:tRNA threonylcarbamoyladenosine biosynthesis protein TsaE
VLVVEWGEGKVEQLADARLSVELTRAPDSEARTLTVRPHGGDWADRVAALM